MDKRYSPIVGGIAFVLFRMGMISPFLKHIGKGEH